MPVQLWISVLTLGSFFGLLALGYYLVLEGTGFFNFAIGPYAMFSAMTCSWLALSQGWNIVLALGVSIVASVGLSVVTDLAVVRVVEKRSEGGELQALIAVVAVLFVLEQLAGTLFGRNVLPGAAWVNGSGIRTASVKLSNQDALLVIVRVHA
jgi:branched-chain amino acid transport system permease protein